MKHNSASLKLMARNNLYGKWGICAGFTSLHSLLVLCLSLCTLPFNGSTNLAGTIVYIIILWIITVLSSVLSSGASYFYLNICRGREFRISDLFAAFKMNPDRFIIVGLITSGISLLIQIPLYV